MQLLRRRFQILEQLPRSPASGDRRPSTSPCNGTEPAIQLKIVFLRLIVQPGAMLLDFSNILAAQFQISLGQLQEVGRLQNSTGMNAILGACVAASTALVTIRPIWPSG